MARQLKTTALARWFGVLTVLGFVAIPAFADSPREFFFRTGSYTGEYTGKEVDKGTFSTDITIDGEMLAYTSNQEAWALDVVLANESNLARTRYFGISAGKRYFFGDAIETEQQVGSDLIKLRPTWAMFLGADLGMGQFLVLPFGDVLSTYATLLQAGGCVGVRKVFTHKFSMDLTLGYDYGASVASSTNVTVTTIKGFLGFGYSF